MSNPIGSPRRAVFRTVLAPGEITLLALPDQDSNLELAVLNRHPLYRLSYQGMGLCAYPHGESNPVSRLERPAD